MNCNGCLYELIHRCSLCGFQICRIDKIKRNERGLSERGACVIVEYHVGRSGILCAECYNRRRWA